MLFLLRISYTKRCKQGTPYNIAFVKDTESLNTYTKKKKKFKIIKLR